MSPTLVFLLVAAALVAVALAFVLPALLGSSRRPAASRARLNANLYREQLSDVERDRVLGLVGEDDAARARDELHRRLLADVEPEPVRPAGRGRAAALVVAAAVPAGAALLYLAFGHPRELDRPPAGADPAAAVAGVEALEAHVREQPTAARAWVMLGRARMERNAFAAAADAFHRGLETSPKVARDVGVLCEYADAVAMAQGGSLRGRPAELVLQALTLDGNHPQALEMAGSAALERGDYDAAVAYWQRLLGQLEPGTTRHRELASAIGRLRRKANTSP